MSECVYGYVVYGSTSYQQAPWIITQVAPAAAKREIRSSLLNVMNDADYQTIWRTAWRVRAKSARASTTSLEYIFHKAAVYRIRSDLLAASPTCAHLNTHTQTAPHQAYNERRIRRMLFGWCTRCAMPNDDQAAVEFLVKITIIIMTHKPNEKKNAHCPSSSRARFFLAIARVIFMHLR